MIDAIVPLAILFFAAMLGLLIMLGLLFSLREYLTTQIWAQVREITQFAVLMHVAVKVDWRHWRHRIYVSDVSGREIIIVPIKGLPWPWRADLIGEHVGLCLLLCKNRWCTEPDSMMSTAMWSKTLMNQYQDGVQQAWQLHQKEK